MWIITRSLIFTAIFCAVLCCECMQAGNLFDYDEISVIRGVKLRKQRSITDTQMQLNAPTIRSELMSGNISMRSLMNDFLSSHVLEFNLSTLLQKDEESEVPRRRRHHQAFQMVLMGIVIFLMFFVTLGFQFLATFGGKAFLMAKLALLLASINGLRRVASSGVHYGLYHTPDPNMYYYDRFDRPRESSKII